MFFRNLQDCDLAIGPIVPTIVRYQVAEPLPQYYFIQLAPCAGTRRLYATDIFAYVTALDRQVRLDAQRRQLTCVNNHISFFLLKCCVANYYLFRVRCAKYTYWATCTLAVQFLTKEDTN